MPGEENVGVLASALHSDGSYAESLMVEAPASRLNPRIHEGMLREGRHYPVMDGRNIFKLAVHRLPEVTVEVLQEAGVGLDQVDLIIPHQANLRINQAYEKALSLPEGKVFHNIQRYGNTTAASIPLALDEAWEQGRIGPGGTVLLVGLGAGLTWGAVLHRFPEA
jgi:3-oxoacyl-[acyl-carrier-protein] synthase-3